MPKKWISVLLITVIVLLGGCGKSQGSDVSLSTTAAPTYSSTEMTAPATTESKNQTTLPLHSDLFLPDYTLQQVTEYFEEVVLNVEYSDGTGDDSLVQKWLQPLYYQVYGAPTDADMDTLNAFCLQLNRIPGFPGIYPAEDINQQNVSISFLGPEEFQNSFSEIISGEDAYGACQYWYYTDSNELHTGRIGCRTDIDQSERNSIIQEEIINILGITDTVLRQDSITYQYSNDNTVLSEMDLLIVSLLYHPSIQCGFSRSSCADAIHQLYY